MTLPKKVSFCPICGKMFAALANHLRRGHSVANGKERSILLKLGTGRIPIRLEPCPVPGCPYKSSRLDKHLDNGHGELSHAALKAYTDQAKRNKAVALLAQLRASNPVVPMASTLDIDVGEDLDEPLLGPEEEEEPETSSQEACKQCKVLQRQVAR